MTWKVIINWFEQRRMDMAGIQPTNDYYEKHHRGFLSKDMKSSR